LDLSGFNIKESLPGGGSMSVVESLLDLLRNLCVHFFRLLILVDDCERLDYDGWDMILSIVIYLTLYISLA